MKWSMFQKGNGILGVVSGFWAQRSPRKKNYVNPSIPKNKKFDEYHFTKWVLSDERFQKGNGR